MKKRWIICAKITGVILVAVFLCMALIIGAFLLGDAIKKPGDGYSSTQVIEKVLTLHCEDVPRCYLAAGQHFSTANVLIQLVSDFDFRVLKELFLKYFFYFFEIFGCFALGSGYQNRFGIALTNETPTVIEQNSCAIYI